MIDDRRITLDIILVTLGFAIGLASSGIFPQWSGIISAMIMFFLLLMDGIKAGENK